MKKSFEKQDIFYLAVILLYFIWFYSSNYNVGTINNIDEGYFLSLIYRTSLGEMPFKDFNWIYGPLMLYYYAALYKLFSISLITARIGYIALYALVVIMTYFLAKRFMPRFYALLCSVMLVGILKLYNAMYTHIGCTLAGLGILFMVSNYLKTREKKYLLFAGLLCGFSLTVKMNVGIAMFAAVIVFLILNYILENYVNGKKLELFNKNLFTEIFIYIGASLVVVIPVYFYFYQPLTLYQFKKTIPWYSIYHYYRVGWNPWPVEFSLRGLKLWFLDEPFIPLMVRVLPLLFAGVIIYKIRSKQFAIFESSLLLLIIFKLFISVENFVYVGKIQYAQPAIIICFMYIVYLIGKTLKNKTAIYTLRAVFAIFLFLYIYTYAVIPVIKKDEMFGKYIPLKRAHMYAENNKGTDNFLKIIDFIQKNTAPKEKIFVLPFESYLYFYSERDNTTRADSMEYGIIYTKEDEEDVINSLKKNKPRFIFISNRIMMDEKSLGVIWGKSYQQDVKKYIFDNYHFIKQIGDFKAANNMEFMINYSCRIYEINKN